MPPRFRTSIVVFFVLVFLYYFISFLPHHNTRAVVLFNARQTSGVAKDGNGHGTIQHDAGDAPVITKEQPKSVRKSSTLVRKPTTSSSVTPPKATKAATDHGLVSQEQFSLENEALGV